MMNPSFKLRKKDAYLVKKVAHMGYFSCKASICFYLAEFPRNSLKSRRALDP
eukprot:CAMPEP_0201527396 /NCGR_PEP_ID=MMETSP0161_2-20130828/35062_1 /ASSEMBLY_ACC=CAM_ASM_000251 /TAXON_ID=180227 /ORGANISM="Neoparamoeba aestuarina, Strain SoJaBio B1-5/56/2" /LENGTH=51 /DNA_ID=CAMNT_0047928221 /DNA_START=130 /DNA_END=281 /DNA_ORIENTATION=+